jgi:hypothetical protein
VFVRFTELALGFVGLLMYLSRARRFPAAVEVVVSLAWLTALLLLVGRVPPVWLRARLGFALAVALAMCLAIARTPQGVAKAGMLLSLVYLGLLVCECLRGRDRRERHPARRRRDWLMTGLVLVGFPLASAALLTVLQLLHRAQLGAG